MTQDRKAQILERLSFGEFYRGELENLKATANENYQALCPFHEDNNPSLSVNFKTGLFKCFGCDAQGDIFEFYQRRHGCDFKEALGALARIAGVEERQAAPAGFLNLTLREFALGKRLPEDFLKKEGVYQNQFPDSTISTDFAYKDQGGKLLAVRHRFGNAGAKKFRWRKGDKVYPYGLWRWQQVQEAGWVLLVEGETDCLTCWHHGLPALGLPGKKTWRRCREALGEGLLDGMQVYLWQEPDARDLPGEVAEDIPGLLVIPAPEEFKDLSQAHCQGRDVPALVEELKGRARPPAPPPPVVQEAFSWSDLGNARRVVAAHGQDLRYSHLSKKWYWWCGTHWAIDNCGEVERRAKLAIAGLYQEAAEAGGAEERKKIAQFALRSEQAPRVLAMVRLAQSEPGIPVQPGELDADPWLFNCRNGTIDLKTGELRPHRREDLITCVAPVEYDPEAYPELWEKFLYQIMDVYSRPAAADRMVTFLQRCLGYSLTGSCQEECLFILWGGGANGKSTLVKTVTAILGDYARNTPVETLLSRNRGGEIPADVARLDGPRFVSAQEVDRGRRLAESLVKAITGRDTISARFLYGEFFDFEPQFKLWLSTNNKPVIKGADDAIWRRIMFVEFPVQIPKEERDELLRDKLLAEATGILAWLVRGCRQWQEEGLDPPEEVLEATAQYRAEMDILADFIADKCLVAPGMMASAADLYHAYCTWADEAGIPEKQQLKQRTFGTCLAERGFRRDKGSGGQRLWRGVDLRGID